MHRILDIHTHHKAPQFQAVVSVSATGNLSPIDGQLYSAGIHPWETLEDIPENIWSTLRDECSLPEVAAIGECGIDLLKGGPLYRQMQVMKRQVELSEELHKPLIIHNVHAHDIIIGLKKDLKPTQPWVVHGFRGKPTIAGMLTDAGIWLSFGIRFNDASVAATPLEMMLAETDDSNVTITDVIKSLSAIRGKDLTENIAANSSRFLGIDNYSDNKKQ